MKIHPPIRLTPSQRESLYTAIRRFEEMALYEGREWKDFDVTQRGTHIDVFIEFGWVDDDSWLRFSQRDSLDLCIGKRGGWFAYKRNGVKVTGEESFYVAHRW